MSLHDSSQVIQVKQMLDSSYTYIKQIKTEKLVHDSSQTCHDLSQTPYDSTQRRV